MSCDHPNIIKVYDWFEDDDRVMMVTEICTGGDLHDKMVEKKKSRFEEQDCASIIQQVIQAVNYLH
jgi:calcium-dependent protein kinase